MTEQRSSTEQDSPAVADAKDRMMATDYARKYGVSRDDTFWTHFLGYSHRSNEVTATSADWRHAVDVVSRVNPEATGHLAHLRRMAEQCEFHESLREETAPILDYGDDPTAIYSAPLPWHDSDVDPSDWRPEAEHGFCTSVLMVEYAMMHAPDSATADRISDLYSRLSEMAL